MRQPWNTFTPDELEPVPDGAQRRPLAPARSSLIAFNAASWPAFPGPGNSPFASFHAAASARSFSIFAASRTQPCDTGSIQPRRLFLPGIGSLPATRARSTPEDGLGVTGIHTMNSDGDGGGGVNTRAVGSRPTAVCLSRSSANSRSLSRSACHCTSSAAHVAIAQFLLMTAGSRIRRRRPRRPGDGEPMRELITSSASHQRRPNPGSAHQTAPRKRSIAPICSTTSARPSSSAIDALGLVAAASMRSARGSAMSSARASAQSLSSLRRFSGVRSSSSARLAAAALALPPTGSNSGRPTAARELDQRPSGGGRPPRV